MKNKISVTILTKNSERHIKECLESVKDFSEIIILDNGSTDNTLKLSAEFPNVRIFRNEFIGFGPLKNVAASYASNNWIFSLDSDEIVDSSLVTELENIVFDDKNIYAVNRKNKFLNKIVNFSGWNPDWVMRIYNRKHTQFKEVMVHESIIINSDSEKIRLKGCIYHYAVEDISQFLEKINRYSSLSREKQKIISPFFIIFRALYAFFRTYVLKLAFLDGWRGLVISVSNFNGVFYKYFKKYADYEK